MMIITKKYRCKAIVLLLLTFSMSCATGNFLKTEVMTEPDIKGNYTVFLYDEGWLKKVAVLDLEGDDYEFQILGSTHNYSVTNNVPADTALKESLMFLNTMQVKLRKVLSEEGRVVGYQLTPQFQITRFGTAEIFENYYRVDNRNVYVSIGLKHSVEKSYKRRLY